MVNKVRNRPKLLVLSLAALLLVGGIGIVLAYIFTSTEPVDNVFLPSKVTIKIEEKFDGDAKEDVTVKNIGDTDIYVRVKLISYRVKVADGAIKRIGGMATVPNFTPINGWFAKDGYYYYPLPLAPGATAPVLVEKIELLSYNDADGGKQVIEVHGEGIQSVPTSTVIEVWQVGVDSDDHLIP